MRPAAWSPRLLTNRRSVLNMLNHDGPMLSHTEHHSQPFLDQSLCDQLGWIGREDREVRAVSPSPGTDPVVKYTLPPGTYSPTFTAWRGVPQGTGWGRRPSLTREEAKYRFPIFPASGGKYLVWISRSASPGTRKYRQTYPGQWPSFCMQIVTWHGRKQRYQMAGGLPRPWMGGRKGGGGAG